MCIWSKIKQELGIWRVGAMPGIAVIGLVVLVRFWGGLEFLELVALDSFLRWRTPESLDDRILIVGINEPDISNLDKYPLSDGKLANLITALNQHNPTAIGVDIIRDKPQPPGNVELNKIFSQQNNVFGIEKVLSSNNNSRVFKIPPSPALPTSRVGFVDATLDKDGNLRRSLLSIVQNNELKFSLIIKLAEKYLNQKGITLENAPDNPEIMQLDRVRLTQVTSNTGGYKDVDAGGNQILLNFRRGENPFRTVSLADLEAERVNPDWIRDRIVLIGITALSVRDDVNVAGVPSDNPGLIYGVEVQAHAISQIISAVLDDRPLLTVWNDGWEYLWILAWGFLGIALARLLSQSPGKLLIAIATGSLIVTGVCYLLLLEFALWLPVVPSLLVLLINGFGLTASLFYRDRQDLKFKLKDRQFMIEYMSSTIHNRPIQTLKKILRNVRDSNPNNENLIAELKLLDDELHNVGELIEKETISDGDFIHVGNSRIDLQCPLKEILYQVYSSVIVLDYPCYSTIKFKIVKFENMSSEGLTIEQKRSLCRFLEEALINVGKYAKDATRLKVTCDRQESTNIIRVEDNGIGIDPNSKNAKNYGGGTKQAKDLAKQLNGKFSRYPGKKKGTVCELTWSINKSWFWNF
ncbi:MAG: CHASE2 domain-containing protein [Pleurocapsa sp. MO_192.B19]|nr:CHASE2 domain-containing protein [Pleurocapsa sp. MO_192.B19]